MSDGMDDVIQTATVLEILDGFLHRNGDAVGLPVGVKIVGRHDRKDRDEADDLSDGTSDIAR